MDYSEQIIAYLHGNLKGDSLLKFEEEIHQNPAFAEEVNFQRGVLQGFRNQPEKTALYEMSQRVRRADDRREKITRWAYSGGLSIAASLIILFLVFPPSSNNLTPNEIFQAHFHPESVNEISFEDQQLVASGIDNPEAQFEAAKNTFESEDYATAIEEFGSLIAKGQYVDQARLYQGVAYLAENQADKALLVLDQMSDLQNHAQWYKVLAYLQKGDSNTAANDLNTILTNESELPVDYQVYTEKARKLLNELGE